MPASPPPRQPSPPPTSRSARAAPTASCRPAYFALGIPCPFLEEESCSIHPDRPLVCREYLVTSPAELCAGPTQEGVTPVPVPKVSLAARGLQDEREEWFPLALSDGLGEDASKGRRAAHGAGVDSSGS